MAADESTLYNQQIKISVERKEGEDNKNELRIQKPCFIGQDSWDPSDQPWSK